MTEVVNTGAVFKLLDEFSSPLRKLVAGLDAAGKKSTELQAKLDKLGLGGVVAKMRGEWSEMDRDSSAGVDKILKTMGRLGPETGAIFGEMTKGARTALEEIGTSATGLSTEVVGTFGVLKSKAVAELGGIGVATPEAFASIDLAATGLSSDVLTRFAGLKTGAVAELQGISTAAPEALGGVLTATVAMQSDVLAEMRATATGAIEALRGIGAEAPELFQPIASAATAAAEEAIGSIGRINEAIKASVAEMRGLNTEAAAVAARSSGGAAAAAAGAEAGLPGSNRVGRARHGGPHFGRVGTEIPGGHASFGGGPAMAAAGIVGYGVYEAAEMRDEVNRLMITGQVDAEKWGATREQLGKLLMDSASLTGFSVKHVGEALSKSERAMSGLDVQTKMSVTKELIPYAAAEARLKETSLAESLQAMVGLAHMTGVYEPDKIRDLARKFSYVSLSTNSSLPQFEKTLSYSMPILRTGMGMDPDTIMALTAVSQNAGITSTKSGTWLRSFFQGSEPEVGDGEHAKKHNAALRKMGLLNGHNMPTWKVMGADGKTDWNASVAKEGGIIQQHLAHVPIDQRMGVVKNIWGERGGATATMLSMNTFVDQFVTLAGKIQKFKGGADALEEYAKDNPLQKGREAWRDFQNLLIDIGDKALPTVNSALTNLDIVLKALPADWAATKAMWGAAVDNAKAALTGDRPPMTAAGRALPDLANQGMSDFLLGRVPGVTSGSIWGSIWNQINPVGTAHAEGAIPHPGGPLPGPDTGAVTGQTVESLHKALGIPQGIDMSGAVQKAMDGLGLLQKQEELNVWQFGQLNDRTGVLKASFTTLDTGSTGLKGTLDILNQTAMGAARALAEVALGGGAGSASGLGGGAGVVSAAFTTWDETGGSGSGGSAVRRAYAAQHGGEYGRPHEAMVTTTMPSVGSAALASTETGGSGAGSAAIKQIDAATRGVNHDAAVAVAHPANANLPSTGAGAFVPPVGDHLTAGMKNNNLGNIGFFGQHTAGLIGPSNARDVDHSIAKFDTQESGIRAAAALALAKYSKGRHNTWDIIAAAGGWTPGALGPGASVNVARAMGLGNRDDVHLNDPNQMVKFLHGLAVQEHGPAGRFYTEDRIRGALGRSNSATVSAGRPAATVSAPPPRKVSPGVPAGSIQAMNMPPVHVHLTHMLDGKVIAKNTTKHQVADSRFHNSVGGKDPYGNHSPPGTDFVDSA